MRQPVRPALAVALAALVALAPACRSKQEESRAAPGGPTVAVLVTRDFGARVLARGSAAPDRSALEATKAVARVETTYGGRFVQALEGLEGDKGAFRDWFFYVNGIGSGESSAEVRLADGDRLWWDHHRWRDYPNAGVVVGSFPEPFVHGARRPVHVRGSDTLASALRDAGADVVSGPSPWQVLVGADDELRRVPAYRRLAADPIAAGVTAGIRRGAVVVYDGTRLVPRPQARVAVWAARDGDGVVLAVAGLDAEAATRAAEAIAADPALLRGRFAAALDGDGRVVAGGGQP